MVSNVWYQLNGTGWSNAVSANNWTNWSSAEMLLAPGTNVVQAYAVDTSGNVSTTSSLSFQYVVTNQLQLCTGGLGTFSPNYSNAWLEIGRNYTMTATPGTGFTFTNWTGGTSLPLNWLTNKTTLQFMMQSSLILQASFVDTQRPTLSITNLTSGQRISNTVFIVWGMARDNWMVSNVWYQLNGTGWSNAVSANNWTNWSSAGMPLTPGTNVVQAYAVDTSGNVSTTNSVSFVSSQTLALRLAFGAGSPPGKNSLEFDLQISPGMNGRIEASTNLVDWVTLTNFVGTGITLHFRDAATTNFDHRFYRAVSP